MWLFFYTKTHTSSRSLFNLPHIFPIMQDISNRNLGSIKGLPGELRNQDAQKAFLVSDFSGR